MIPSYFKLQPLTVSKVGLITREKKLISKSGITSPTVSVKVFMNNSLPLPTLSRVKILSLAHCPLKSLMTII